MRKKAETHTIGDLYDIHTAQFFTYEGLPSGESLEKQLFEGLKLNEMNCPDIKNFYDIKFSESK